MVTLHQMQSCQRCARCDDPVCRFVMRQFKEAEERVRYYAEAHQSKAPDVDVAITCFSRNVAFHGPGA